MLSYSFLDVGNETLYEHLYKCLKNDIICENLKAGTKLPSKRNFAKNLGISTITVENAYYQLLAEGYVYSIPKKGYFVAKLSSLKNQKINKQPILQNSEPENFFVDFAKNQTSPENFPFSIWSKLMREVMSDSAKELVTNSPGNGIKELRTAICEHLKAFRGMNVLPEQIIVGAGTEYLYGLLIQLLGHDKTYATIDPGYSKIHQIYTSNNALCKFIPLDNNGVNISALDEQKIDVVHISPSHHYPTGIIMPISRRYELIGWALKDEKRFIIEDEYDSEFRLMGQPIPTLQSIDVSEKVIYINTFTKSLASTIRISYMVLPMHLMDLFHQKLSFYSCTVSNFEQYTLARFISEGYFEKHINRMRNYYRKTRDKLLNAIKNSSLKDKCEISEESSGLHFLMKIKTELDDKTLINNIKSQGINVFSLSQFHHQSPCTNPHTLVINYSALDADKIDEAVSRLLKAEF